MLTLSRTKRLDWPRMLANIRKQGMSLQQVADHIGVTREGLGNWTAEEAIGEPAFWTGAAMIELWCASTGLGWNDLPTRTVTLSVSAVLRQTA